MLFLPGIDGSLAFTLTKCNTAAQIKQEEKKDYFITKDTQNTNSDIWRRPGNGSSTTFKEIFFTSPDLIGIWNIPKPPENDSNLCADYSIQITLSSFVRKLIYPFHFFF
jgi:hypothetical protein